MNDLKEEVANVAARLGLRSHSGSAYDFKTHTESSTRARQGSNRRKRNNGPLPDRFQKNSRNSKSEKKSGTKTDAYDKKALLEILSGPEEHTSIDLKKLKKARSILSKTASPLWYEALEELPSLNAETNGAAALTSNKIDRLKREAEDLCQNENDAFVYRMHVDNKQNNWLLQVRKNGTHVDRIAAASLLTRDAIVANIGELDVLMGMAEKQKGSRDIVLHALKALTELFRCYLLPDRKLQFFENRPLTLLDMSKGAKLHKIYWYLEDSIKRRYVRFVSILEATTRAPLDHLRSESISMTSELLYDKPEQEARLLSILMHKLGDKSRKLGSKTAFLISKLIVKHPQMKRIVLREAEKLVYLQGTTIRTIRCVLQIFNSVEYQRNEIDRNTAAVYIDMCFTLFQQLVDGNIGSRVDLERKAQNKASIQSVKGKRKHVRSQEKRTAVQNEIDATVFGALIAGIRRALPFADTSVLGDLLEKHTQALFRMVHIAPFGVAVQVLALLFQILPAQAHCLDRLYRALYEKILDPRMTASRRLPLFISTVFKAIKEDPNLTRAIAFVKRLCQVACLGEPHLFSAFLLVVSEIIKFKPGLKSGILQAEERNQIPDKKIPARQSKGGKDKTQQNLLMIGEYNMDHREPVYCGADRTCLWEICSALRSYHPVTQSMGLSLLKDQSISSRGDPAQELTFFAFLEKFVNGRDWKLKTVNSRISMTPGSSAFHLYSNSEAFDVLAAKDVPVYLGEYRIQEDAFFHKYFNLQNVKKTRDARLNAKQTKRSRQEKQAAFTSEDVLGDGDDLESMESLEIDGDAVDVNDIDSMFGKKALDRKPNNALFDYSDLMEKVQGIHDDDMNSDSEDIDMASIDDDAFSENDKDNAIQLPTEEFPELSSDSDVKQPQLKRRKKKSHLSSDFAPADDYTHLLDSD